MRSPLRIKTTDAAKLQDEYAKLVEGLQDRSDEAEDDGIMTNPRTQRVTLKLSLTHTFCKSYRTISLVKQFRETYGKQSILLPS